MQYLKFGLVFDLSVFHQLNLYQAHKTLRKLIFIVFFLFLYLVPLSTLNLL